MKKYKNKRDFHKIKSIIWTLINACIFKLNNVNIKMMIKTINSDDYLANDQF